MQTRIIQQSEDLIIALLIGDSRVTKIKNYHELTFTLPQHKHYILESFLKYNGLIDVIQLEQINEDQFILKSSILFENIIRDWTDGRYLKAVNPQLLKKSTFMLWLCLFAEKLNDEVVVKHNQPDIQVIKTIADLFKSTMDTVSLYIREGSQYIKVIAFDELLFKSLSEKRPGYETLELTKLLTPKAKINFDRKKMRREGDHSLYVY